MRFGRGEHVREEEKTEEGSRAFLHTVVRYAGESFVPQGAPRAGGTD